MQMTAAKASLRSFVPRAAAVLLVLYAIVLTHWIDGHRMFWGDELLGWYYYTDPSWKHVMLNWTLGGEGSGYLFNGLAWSIVHILGSQHLNPIRYYCSLCIAAGFILWASLLRSAFRSVLGVLLCAILWFADRDLLAHVGESRFYGQYILGTALVFWVATRVEEDRFPAWLAGILAFAAGATFAGAQVLGVYWVGAAIVGQLLTRRFTPAKIAAMAGFLLSLFQMYFYLSLFKTSSHGVWWIPKPHLRDLVHLFLRSPVGGYGLQAVLLAGVAFAGYRLYQLARQGEVIAPGKRIFLVLLTLFVLGLLGLFVVSHLMQSVYLPRYLLPGVIAMTGFFAWGVDEVAQAAERRFGKRWLYAAVPLFFVALVVLHLRAMRDLKNTSYNSFSDLAGLLHVSGDLPVVFCEVDLQQQLHLYHPQFASRFFLTLPPELTRTRAYRDYDSVYRPFWVNGPDFLVTHPRFIYIQTYWSHAMGLDQVLTDPAWNATPLPDIPVGGAVDGRTVMHAWEVTRTHTPGGEIHFR